MDLTPKNHWRWPIFNCCRPPSPSASTDDEEQDHDESYHNEYFFSTAPPLKVTTTRWKVAVGSQDTAKLDTPTTACSAGSAGETKDFLDKMHAHY
jgi:hypothetical protein